MVTSEETDRLRLRRMTRPGGQGVRRRQRVVLATEDVQRARQRWLTDRPVGLAYPQVVADDRHQQLEPIGTGQDLGGQSTVARELPGQLTIVGEVQIGQGSGQMRRAIRRNDNRLRRGQTARNTLLRQ